MKPLRSQQWLLIYFQQCNQWVSNHQFALQWLWGSRWVSSWKSDLWPAGWCWTNKTVMNKQEIFEQWRITDNLCVPIFTPMINGWSVIIIHGLSFSCCLWHRGRCVECTNIKFVHVNVLEVNQDISVNSQTGSISANVPLRAAVARCCALSCVNDPSDNPWNPQKSLKNEHSERRYHLNNSRYEWNVTKKQLRVILSHVTNLVLTVMLCWSLADNSCRCVYLSQTDGITYKIRIYI